MATLPPEITKEIDNFEQAVQDFLGQKISDGKFQRIRLQHGVYGQRQDGVQMIRIKIPYGGLTTEQWECIADVCEEYSRGIAHITTRQDIQIHYVKVVRVPELMRKLAAVGITTREACGNTVRNVTACPYAGVSPTEPFDVTPYANAFYKHMIRNPICQNMGRKFKVAFEGCDHDHARLRIHDIGFQAKVKDGQRGFQVLIGGGLGATPFVAHELYNFMPAEEMLPVSEAILRVFDRYGERKVRSKARMKFLIKKVGFDKFKEMVEAERKILHVGSDWNDYLQSVDEPYETSDHAAVGEAAEETDDYKTWKASNVLEQRQNGFSMVEIRTPLGDMVPEQMRSLAELTRKFSNGMLRTSIEQNMHLRYVHHEDLPALYQALKKIDMARADAGTIYDVTACPGTDTCRLGVAASRPLATVLEERLKAENGVVSQLADQLLIKISGCPNSCGQHHIGNIGFSGAALPQDKHVAPAFQLYLGGEVKADSTSIGQIVMKIPSKNVPEATIRILKHYAENRQGDEALSAFFTRIGRKAVQELLADLAHVPEYDQNPDFYVDWGDKEEFGLQQGVIGECAGSPVADVAPELIEAEAPLEQARAFKTHGENEAVIAKSFEAMAKAADAMLYSKMVQTFNAKESIQEFDNHFVRTGDFPELDDFRYKVDQLHNGKVDEKTAEAILDQAETMIKLCKERKPAHVAAS